MPRLTPVFVTVLALAVPSVVVAAPQAAAKGNKDVTVRVMVCHPGDEGAASVTIDPWFLLLNVGDEAEWKLHITRPKKNWIVVEPKKGKGWPYKEKKHEGKAEAHAKGMVDEPRGDYTYNITIYCNNEGTVIDPRVRVGP